MPDEQGEFARLLAEAVEAQVALMEATVALDLARQRREEEKRCDRCEGRGFVLMPLVRYHWPVDCPKCHGLSTQQAARQTEVGDG